MFGRCVAKTAMSKENFWDLNLRNIHIKKIRCSKFKEKNMLTSQKILLQQGDKIHGQH